jgi:hypothetical protein
MDDAAMTRPPAAVQLPLAGPEPVDDLLGARRLERLTVTFLALGLLARCVRYFLRFPLWEDESFLCANFIGRDFRGLLEPLHYQQVSPILFLWLELAVTRVFGYTEMTLRLMPFLAGVASLFLFHRLARTCLTGLPRLFAVAIFSVTYGTIRYSAEAKPYGIDLFVSLLLATCAVNWLSRPESNHWLWLLTVLVPPALGLSFGAVFVSGGLALALAWTIVHERRWRALAPWAAFCTTLLAGFVVVYWVNVRAQCAAELESMREYWVAQFPPLRDPLAFLAWVVRVHAGDLMAYPAGGLQYQSSLSALCWMAGLAVLARRRQAPFLLLALGPQMLTFVAAVLRRYPYGGPIRLNFYLAPFTCMVIAYGASALLARLARRRRGALAATHVALLGLAVVGLTCVVRDFASPYKNVSDARARGFAQWFWFNAEQGGEVACLTSDLGITFAPEQFAKINFSAQYLCNQRIYSPRHAAGEPVRWDRISPARPLRCVYYRVNALPFDERAFAAWLEDMQSRYELHDRESYPAVRIGKMGDVRFVDAIEIFRFVPREGSETPVMEMAQTKGLAPPLKRPGAPGGRKSMDHHSSPGEAPGLSRHAGRRGSTPPVVASITADD